MKREDRVWGRSVEGCRLSASLPASKPELGRPVELILVFHNEGPAVIKFPRFSLWFDYEYAVRNERDEDVPMTEFGKQQREAIQAGAAMALPEIAPGQEIIRTVEISRLYELRHPAKYKIQAWKEVPSPSGQGFIKVISNTVEFEIVRARQDAPPR